VATGTFTTVSLASHLLRPQREFRVEHIRNYIDGVRLMRHIGMCN
jgi:hypothetical protein